MHLCFLLKLDPDPAHTTHLTLKQAQYFPMLPSLLHPKLLGVRANDCHNVAGQKRSAHKERERCAALAREWDEKVDRTSEHAESPRIA